MTESEKRLRAFLQRYIGQGKEKKDLVQKEDVEDLVEDAVYHSIEQEIIDYGTENPNAQFWEFLKLIPTGLYGVTEEELLQDDD